MKTYAFASPNLTVSRAPETACPLRSVRGRSPCRPLPSESCPDVDVRLVDELGHSHRIHFATRPEHHVAEAIFAAQTPMTSPCQGYALSSLSCVDLQVPFGNTANECSIAFETDGGQPVTVNANAPSALAQDLFDALTAAGATTCLDPHGVRVMLENVAVSPGDIQFDDASNFTPLPAPNVVVGRADGQRVITAFAHAGILAADPVGSRRGAFSANERHDPADHRGQRRYFS